MTVAVSLFVIQYAIFSDQFNRIGAKPMIGHNIVNAQANEYPFVVSLMRINIYNPNPIIDHSCTGTLISKRDVVTSEHCVISQNIRLHKIVVGSVYLGSGNSHYLSWWITYEQWAMNVEYEVNDVANIRLIMEVSSEIAPVRIANMLTKDLYGVQATLVGWGYVNETGINPYLKKTRVNILTNRECIRKLNSVSRYKVSLSSKQAFCSVADPYVLLTDGDSGGPILYRNSIVGVSKGTCPNTIERNSPNLVNMHMAIRYYKPFLLSVMRLA